MPYTYCHISSDSSIFYIGKGVRNRAYVTTDKSDAWHEKASQGFEVLKLAEWKTDKEALDHEKFLIWLAKDLGWQIVNKTTGGQGVAGFSAWKGRKHKEETKEKIRLGNLGKKRRKSKKFSIANSKTSNPRWKGYWVTPEGKFETALDAAKHFNVDTKTITSRCKGYKEKLVGGIKIYPPKDGWSFKEKE
jgi:hypothetical protein